MATVMETIAAHAKRRNNKASERKTFSSDVQPEPELLTHESIAVLAYRFWQERGCPAGSPEVDWFRAEQQLQSINGHRSETE